MCSLILSCLASLALAAPLGAAETTWQEALSQMPLKEPINELNRTNCVGSMLAAFRSNQIVRALVFMPGATDEFYLFRRARAALTNSHPTLLDAVAALTNQTYIRAAFQPPFLLLHTEEDPLESANIVNDQNTVVKLHKARVEHLCCNDWDWDALQPVLKHSLKIGLRPWRYSTQSWHFYRHSFAAWGLDGFEALEVAGLAGKSKFVLGHKEARFEVDPRVLAAPKFNAQLR